MRLEIQHRGRCGALKPIKLQFRFDGIDKLNVDCLLPSFFPHRATLVGRFAFDFLLMINF